MSDEIRYFSERDSGEVPREAEEIGSNAWRGILAKIRALAVDRRSFGAAYPAICPDGNYRSDGANTDECVTQRCRTGTRYPNCLCYDEQDYSGPSPVEYCTTL